MVVRGVEQGIYSSFAELEVEEALAQSREGRKFQAKWTVAKDGG